MIPPSNPEKPPLESAKRSIVVDMSPAAIDRRIRELAALWDFWNYLRKFRPVTQNSETLPKASAPE